MKNRAILGIWDGHDSGAALIKDDKIIIAVNEERYTRRKLEIKFPINSINEILKYVKKNQGEISAVAVSTSDFTKTLTRVIPALKERYYLVRRHKKQPSMTDFLMKIIKYKITQFGSNYLTRLISGIIIKKKLRLLGLNNKKVYFVDHHQCHAEAAARTSGFKEAVIITIDGLGDGLSGTVSFFSEGRLKRYSSISSLDSVGIYFEFITQIMNFRELEDEGKVMALAGYAYPTDISKNPMKNFFEVRGIQIKGKYSALMMYRKLKNLCFLYPREQFCYLAQQCLEYWVIQLIKNAVKQFKCSNICLSGGIFANIVLNMKIRNIEEVKKCYVFPHMGDGGLGLGAAVALNYRLNKVDSYKFNSLYLGTGYSDSEVIEFLKRYKLNYAKLKNPEKIIADLILKNEIILLFQGRMEYGPRALGNRSIIARPDSPEIKDKLNLIIKKRAWYQPFCPSVLEEDAEKLFIEYDNRTNLFMTMGYKVKKNHVNLMKAVISYDDICRPQFVLPTNGFYYRLLKKIRKKLGFGVILNTSFNIHGFPIVRSPEDAINIFLNTEIKFMLINDFLVKKE